MAILLDVDFIEDFGTTCINKGGYPNGVFGVQKFTEVDTSGETFCRAGIGALPIQDYANTCYFSGSEYDADTFTCGFWMKSTTVTGNGFSIATEQAANVGWKFWTPSSVNFAPQLIFALTTGGYTSLSWTGPAHPVVAHVEFNITQVSPTQVTAYIKVNSVVVASGSWNDTWVRSTNGKLGLATVPRYNQGYRPYYTEWMAGVYFANHVLTQAEHDRLKCNVTIAPTAATTVTVGSAIFPSITPYGANCNIATIVQGRPVATGMQASASIATILDGEGETDYAMVFRVPKGVPLTDSEIDRNFIKCRKIQTLKPAVANGQITNYDPRQYYFYDSTIFNFDKINGTFSGTGRIWALRKDGLLSDPVEVF